MGLSHTLSLSNHFGTRTSISLSLQPAGRSWAGQRGEGDEKNKL